MAALHNMAALRRTNIVATLLQLTRTARPSVSLLPGPGCTCESCVQAWDRHHPRKVSGMREGGRLKFGLY
jgi:hypothetical protein